LILALPLLIACAVVALAAFLYLDRWWSRRAARRALARTASESGCTIAITDKDVSCTRPDGTVERVAWDDLQTVELGAAPVSWLLTGTSGACAIPQGAAGEGALIRRLQGLPGFDNGAVVAAMSRSDDQRTVCWRKLRPIDSSP